MTTLTERPYYPWLCWGLAAVTYFFSIWPLSFSFDDSGLYSKFLGYFLNSGWIFLSASMLYTLVIIQIPVGLMFDRFSSRSLMFYSTLVMALGGRCDGSDDELLGWIGRAVVDGF